MDVQGGDEEHIAQANLIKSLKSKPMKKFIPKSNLRIV